MRAAVCLVLFAAVAGAAPVPKAARPDPDGHGYLGITFAADNDLGVSEVTPGTPAFAAGLKAGDVFLSAGEFAPKTRADLQLFVGGQRPGTRVRFVVDRGGTPTPVVVTLGVMPPEIESTFLALRRQSARPPRPVPARDQDPDR